MQLSEYELDKCQALVENALVDKGKGDYEAALLKFAEVMQMGIKQADLYYQIADTYFLQEDYARTIIWCRQSLGLDKKFVHAYWLAAMASAKLNNIKEMLAFLSEGVKAGSLGEYEEIFANILAEKNAAVTYRKLIMVKFKNLLPIFFAKPKKAKKDKAAKPAPAAEKKPLPEKKIETEPMPRQEVPCGCKPFIEELEKRLHIDESAAEIVAAAEQQGFVSAAQIEELNRADADDIIRAAAQVRTARRRVNVLNILATGFFAKAAYDKSLAILLAADRIEKHSLTSKNIAALLCQLGEVGLAEEYLQEAGKNDIMALNLLSQIKSAAKN